MARCQVEMSRIASRQVSGGGRIQAQRGRRTDRGRGADGSSVRMMLMMRARGYCLTLNLSEWLGRKDADRGADGALKRQRTRVMHAGQGGVRCVGEKNRMARAHHAFACMQRGASARGGRPKGKAG